MAKDGDELRQQIEAMTGMPYDLAHSLITSLYRSDVDETADAVREHLLSCGITNEELNADMFEVTEGMRARFSPKPSNGDLNEERATMLFIDKMYLGHLVHKYREHLFNVEE